MLALSYLENINRSVHKAKELRLRQGLLHVLIYVYNFFKEIGFPDNLDFL